MRTAVLLRSSFSSAMMAMLLTSNLGGASQPPSPYEDNGLDMHRNLQDCGPCMEDVITYEGETSCTVCTQVISDCLSEFQDDSYYGAVGVCTPCGSISTSELEDFYTELCGELSDVTKYTVENCWSYLVPSCPDYTTDSSDDYTTDSSDDYTTDSSDDYTTDSSDDYTTDSSDDYTTDSSDDYTTDSSDDYTMDDDPPVASTAVTTDDDSVTLVAPNSSNGTVFRCGSIGGYLALAVFTVLLSTWMR
ncbi:unnamed protein product [Ectocarpus sp. 12 AP-2014]